MDLEFATGILGALPELGGLSGLTVLVVILLRWQGQTATRHGEELDRMAKLHREALAAAHQERDRYREQRDDAEDELRQMYAPPQSHPTHPAWQEYPDPTPTGSPRPGRRRRDP